MTNTNNLYKGNETMPRRIKNLSYEEFEEWLKKFQQRTREALVLGILLFVIAILLMALSIILFRDKLSFAGATLVFGLSGIFCASGAGIIAAGAITNLKSLAEIVRHPDEEKQDKT